MDLADWTYNDSNPRKKASYQHFVGDKGTVKDTGKDL